MPSSLNSQPIGRPQPPFRLWRPALVALAPLALAGLLQAQPKAAPQAVVPGSVVDVGAIAKGDPVKHTFEIRNEGTAPLKITRVKPTCGCTVAKYDRRIAPGATGSVEAVVETEKIRGAIAKTVHVLTNDPDNPKISLVIKANVKARIEADPGYARFIAVQGEGAQTSTQTVWAPGRSDFEVVRVVSPYRFVTADFRRAAEGEGKAGRGEPEWSIDLTLAANAPAGALADHLQVHTNHPQQKVLEIPVSGFVRPVLTVTPRIADFGRRELTEPQTASLEIKNLGAAAVSLGEVASTVEGLEAAVEPLEEGRRYKVVLTLSPSMAKGPFTGKLTIATTSSRLPRLEVDVKGVVL